MTITDKYVAALGEIAELKEQIDNMSILLNAQKGELNELKKEYLTDEEMDAIGQEIMEEYEPVFRKLLRTEKER